MLLTALGADHGGRFGEELADRAELAGDTKRLDTRAGLIRFHETIHERVEALESFFHRWPPLHTKDRRSEALHARGRLRRIVRAVRLDHVVLAVRDFERSNAFYRDVVGAEIVVIDGRVAYRVGEQQLNVHGPGVTPAMVARIPVPPGGSDVCFVWEGPIEGAVEHLGRHGVAIEAGPMLRAGARGRGTSVYFRDPDGSLLEFISYSSAP